MPLNRCPVCDNKHHLVSPREAEAVYNTSSWRGNTGMLKISSADTVCAWCKSIRIAGEWTRFQSLDSRAQELSQTGNKSKSEYKDSLAAGDLNV